MSRHVRTASASLGYWPHASLTDARVEVQKIKHAVAEGLADPAAERNSQRHDRIVMRQNDLTVSRAVEIYVTTRLSDDTKHHRNEVSASCPTLADLRISDMVLREPRAQHLVDIERLHRGRPATVRARIGALQRFLSDAERRGLIDANPATRLRKPPPPRPRQLGLTAVDVRALWHAKHAKQEFMRMMLLVPMRFSEMASLRAENMRNGEITLLRTKNGDEFSIPPGETARAILRQAAERAGDGPLFPGMSATSRITRQIRVALGADTSTGTDLRRLFVSTLADHEVGDPDLLNSLTQPPQQRDPRRRPALLPAEPAQGSQKNAHGSLGPHGCPRLHAPASGRPTAPDIISLRGGLRCAKRT